MSSHQRKRGQLVKVWKTKAHTDRRGNIVKAADPTDFIIVRAAFVPERSSKAEVPGQQQINVMRMIVAADLPDVEIYSHVEWAGRIWDIVTPPQYHHGTRQVRHWSMDLRERP